MSAGTGAATRSPGDGAEGEERFREALPIEGAPAVWYDAPPPDDYHVDVADDDATEDEAPAPAFPDPVTLRPARRTGGFRPRSPSAPLTTPRIPEAEAAAAVEGDPPPTYRPARPYGAGRRLPNVGTEAIGRCTRIVPHGAIIDFSGHRGLAHASELVPGTRVDRVEDVIAVGDEVVVRVISVDYEAHRIDLSLLGPAPRGTTGVPRRPMVPGATAVPASLDDALPVAPVDSGVGSPAPPALVAGTADSSPGAAIPADIDAPAHIVTPAPASVEAPPASPPPGNGLPTAPVAPVTEKPPVRPVPAAIPSATAATIPAGTVAPPAGPGRAGFARPATPPVTTPPARRREIVGYVPGARVRDVVPTPPAAPARTVPARTAPARPQEVARSGSHAMRRELDDPSHPMARLLAAGADAFDAAPARPVRPARPVAAPVPVPDPEPVPPARVTPAARLVHADDDPEPAPPPGDAPATIEALAARFATRQVPVAPSRPAGRTSRSQAAREEQARMLDRLRRQG